MDQILNYLLAGVLAYLMLTGLKDKDAPDVSIKFPKDGYEFRSSKSISLFSQTKSHLLININILFLFELL